MSFAGLLRCLIYQSCVKNFQKCCCKFDFIKSKSILLFLVISPRNYRQQKAIDAEIAFQVKIIGSKTLPPSLFSLKYNNKKKTLKIKLIPTENLFICLYYRFSLCFGDANTIDIKFFKWQTLCKSHKSDSCLLIKKNSLKVKLFCNVVEKKVNSFSFTFTS